MIASLAAQIQDICLVYAPPPLFLELATKIGCCLTGRYQAFEKHIYNADITCPHLCCYSLPLRPFLRLLAGNGSSCDSGRTPQRVLNDVLFVLLCFLGGTARKLVANDCYDRCSAPCNVTHVTGAAPGSERYSLTVARQLSKRPGHRKL